MATEQEAKGSFRASPPVWLGERCDPLSPLGAISSVAMSLTRRDIAMEREGLRVMHYPLWLDTTRKQSLGFVSHAHSDHIARHARVIATAPTLALMAHRLGRLERTQAVRYREPFQLGPLTLELFSAGHVLGSAQLRITFEGKRVVYTGDLNHLSDSLTAEPTEIAECDVLVIESTFGHPRYRFPPRTDVFAQLRSFVDRCFAEGSSPVVLGYALGKSQEAVQALGQAGYALCAHESVHAVCEVYREHGMALPPVRRFDGTVGAREVLIFPPNLRRSGQLNRVRRPRTAMLTGWALDEQRSRSFGVNEMIPLSDHADHPSLIKYALATGARQVFTVHGFCEELARSLRERGLDARPLAEGKQLELF
jgi:putative mRNA 3-end processing factor